MNLSQPEIERIVQEVLRRLSAMTHSSSDSSPVPTTLSLTTRVVTVAELNGKLEGIKQITVAQRAVVTPAARDYLRERGVQLTRSG